MRGAGVPAWCVLALAAVSGASAAAQTLDRRQMERFERTLRQEGAAVLAMAEAADAGRELPADFTLRWHNDYLKASTGTFVPFIVSIAEARVPAVLLYVRVAAAGGEPAPGPYAFEDVYPVELPAAASGPIRVSRGFAVPAGEYDVIVVAREREHPEASGRRLLAAALRRRLTVPDFAASRLTTSSVMLGDRLVTLGEGEAPDLSERPYVLGSREIARAIDGAFRRDGELVILLLIYHPTRTENEHFDLEVEYHFFRRLEGPGPPGTPGASPAVSPAPAGEQYFNRTEPQRFNPVVLGPLAPADGQPILAGQRVPLAGLEQGDYRLAIIVTDRVSGERIERQVTFTVGS